MNTARSARVLVAVDGSDRAQYVLDAASREATSRGAELVVLRVVGIPRVLPADALAVSPDHVANELVDQARAETSALVSTHPMRILIEAGTPVDTILRVAEEENVELLVIGAHGYRFAERVFGTTAGRVVERALRSVLVVR